MKAAIFSTAALSLFLTGCCDIDDLAASDVPFSSCVDSDGNEKITDNKFSLGLDSNCSPQNFNSTCSPLFPDSELRCRISGLFYGGLKVDTSMVRDDVCYEGPAPSTSNCPDGYTEYSDACRRCRSDDLEIDPASGLCIFSGSTICTGANFQSFGLVCIILSDQQATCPMDYLRLGMTSACLATDNPYDFYTIPLNAARDDDCPVVGVSDYNGGRRVEDSDSMPVAVTSGTLTLPNDFSGNVVCAVDGMDGTAWGAVNCMNGVLSPPENEFREVLGSCLNNTQVPSMPETRVAMGVTSAATATHCIIDGIITANNEAATRICMGTAMGVEYDMWNADLNIIEIPRGSMCTFDCTGTMVADVQDLVCSGSGEVSDLETAAGRIFGDCA